MFGAPKNNSIQAFVLNTSSKTKVKMDFDTLPRIGETIITKYNKAFIVTDVIYNNGMVVGDYSINFVIVSPREFKTDVTEYRLLDDIRAL